MKIKDLFTIVKAKPLELINTSANAPSVNFVSRTSENNGVVAFVDRIEGETPYPAGTITVALGGSVLSSFVQDKEYYTAFHIAVLYPKKELSLLHKLYYCHLINANKYRYNYGRQANKTLSDIEIPDELPTWINDIDLNRYKEKIKTSLTKPTPMLDVSQWIEYSLVNFFDMFAGKFYYQDDYTDGDTPYISASNTNNGIMKRINLEPDFERNCITIGKVGMTTFYQGEDFCATSDVTILKPKFKLNKYIGMFLVSILNRDGYKWSYGRQIRLGDCQKLKIKLPSKEGQEPDWGFMENYILSLPFSDRI